LNSLTTQSDALAPPANSTVRLAVESLFRHGHLFLGVTAGVLAVTALVTFLTPRSYRSEMNILVRSARPDYLISPERSNGQLQQTPVTEERIGSEVEVLKSHDLLDIVVDPNWTRIPLNKRSEETIRAHDKAVLDFEKHLAVEPLKRSNVIRVAYTTTSPRLATEALNRLLAAFMDKQREMERSNGASTFFAVEAARYKKDLDEAQQQLQAFQQENQIVTLGTRENTLESQINTLEDTIRSTQVQLTEASQRVTSDQRQLARTSPRQPTSQRSVPNTEAVEQLTAMLTTYQNKRTELLTRYQTTDRLVKEVDQQISDTARALANARTTNGQESTTDVNPVFLQLKQHLSASLTEQSALEGKLKDLVGQRDQLKATLKSVEASTVDFTTLQSRVTELASNYQLYTQKKNEASIADALTQHQLVNVAVSEEPTYSATHTSPHFGLNLAMGLFTAAFLACCTVYFAEIGRDTIATPWELDGIVRAPVLATVPVIDGPAPDDPGPGVRRVSSGKPSFVATPIPSPAMTPAMTPAMAPAMGQFMGEAGGPVVATRSRSRRVTVEGQASFLFEREPDRVLELPVQTNLQANLRSNPQTGHRAVPRRHGLMRRLLDGVAASVPEAVDAAAGTGWFAARKNRREREATGS
jgi:uncharacterized protein involved in exopolysaccharide biosynthesis